MLKIILILLIVGAGIFALNHFYKPSRLELTPHMIILKVGKKDANYPYTVMKKEVKTFSNLTIKQYTIDYKDEKLIYEEAQADGLYEFSANPHALISKLFDIQSLETVFIKNGLEALQLELKSGERINLFALQQDGQQLRLLYGMSDVAFGEKVQKLVGKTPKPWNPTPLKHPITHWSDKVNEFDSILTSTDH